MKAHRPTWEICLVGHYDANGIPLPQCQKCGACGKWIEWGDKTECFGQPEPALSYARKTKDGVLQWGCRCGFGGIVFIPTPDPPAIPKHRCLEKLP